MWDDSETSPSTTKDNPQPTLSIMSLTPFLTTTENNPQTSLYNLNMSVSSSTTENNQLTAMLDEFDDLFQPPKTLPPQRSHDHGIPLKEGISPINVRPYRYPNIHKDVIQ
ncbi:hypothetical protein Drorol1_Dr00022099 [Drosera rotundifolia]